MSYGDDLNIYYDPESFGLKILAVVNEPNMSYEFNMVVFWFDDLNKKIYVGADSGCSCPTPFEDFISINSLTPFTDMSVFDHFFYSGHPFDLADVNETRRKVVEKLTAYAA